MKFAIINDIHFGPVDGGYIRGIQRKLISESEKLVKEFVNKMNDLENPEFVINLGDSIEDKNDKEIDTKNFKKVQTLLSYLKMPLYYVIGNHDIKTLDETEIAKIIGINKMYYSFEYSSFHFIVLDIEMTGYPRIDGSDITAKVPEKEIKWLKNDLLKTDKPTIIFIHYGLAEDDMKGNFWFERETQHALLENRKELRKVFENSKKVKAVFSAHQHWNKMKIHNNIPYFTITSLIENFKNDGIPSNAYAVVGLDENKIKVMVKGNDPAEYEFSFR